MQTSDISWFSLPLLLQNDRTETGHIRRGKCWPRLFCVCSIFQIDDGCRVPTERFDLCHRPITVILLRYRLVVGYSILPSLVHHELSPCQDRIFCKNVEFSFILNCIVPSFMLFYNLMHSRVVSKGKICELLGHYRRGPNLHSSFQLTIHYHAIYYWNVSLGLRMCVYRALILKLIWCTWFCHMVLDSMHLCP